MYEHGLRLRSWTSRHGNPERSRHPVPEELIK